MPDRLCIDVEKIRSTDQKFSLHYQIYSEPLLLSIKEIGVINPPLVQRISSDDHFRIVCGFRRVHAARANGIRELDCYVIPPDADDRDLLLISLYDNLAAYPLHPLEKSIVIGKLESYCDREEIIKKYLTLLDLSPHEKVYEENACLARLEDQIKDAFYRGDLTQPVCLMLSHLNPQDCMAVFDLFTKAHLTFSKQKEVTEYLIEIALRESMSLSDLAGSEPITKVLENKDLSKPQKGESIRSILRSRRFPEITLTEQKFKETRHRLRLEKGIKIIPPPSFESDTFKVQLDVNSPKDLQEKIRRLEQTQNDPGWEELFGLCDNSSNPLLS
jgi:ParB-like chromosome segregation protein Spo0J